MKTGAIVGSIAVLAGALLATVTSASANHAATGRGTYATPHHVSSQLYFVVATAGQQFVQSEMVRKRGPMPFRTFMISTTINSFTIRRESAERTVTIEGEMVSTTFLGEGHERQSFAELVPFTATGTDKETAEAGADRFSLEVKYSADQAQGPLFESFGFGECLATICTITFKGRVKEGDIFVHTTGGE